MTQDTGETTKALVLRGKPGKGIARRPAIRPGKLARRSRAELARVVKAVEYLTEQEYMRLLSVAMCDQHKLLMRLLWETGLRISEALALRYSDVYPDGLNIRHGKGDKQRFVPCQAPTLGELLRQRRNFDSEQVFTKITSEPGALLMLRRYGKLAGIEKRLHPHLFRHSFAINFLRQTGNPFALQEIGGWSDMETVKIYLRMAAEMPREAMQRMKFPEV